MGFPVSNPFDLRQVAQPTAPAAGTATFYAKSDNRIYTKISSGFEFSMMGTCGSQYVTDPAPTPTGLAHRNTCFISAQTTAAAFAAPTGPAVDTNTLFIRIKDDGTARALTWNAIYRAIDTVNLPLPTTTVAGKWLYLGFQYNALDAKWDLMALLNQS